jgi:hypothetical protein
MNNYLSAWYRSAGIAPENIPLAKRGEAIDAFAADGDDVAAMTQLFYELTPSDSSFEGKFRTAFNNADPNFGMSGNDRELIVLAGATLANVMENGTRALSDLSTLCLICGGAQNLRKAPAVREIPEAAVKHLSKTEKTIQVDCLLPSLKKVSHTMCLRVNSRSCNCNSQSSPKSRICFGGRSEKQAEIWISVGVSCRWRRFVLSALKSLPI